MSSALCGPGVVHHRQTPQEIRADLQRLFAAEFLEGHPELLERFIPPEPLPNARLAADETVAQTIRGKIEIAEKVLSQEYCGKCHELKSVGPRTAAGRAAPGAAGLVATRQFNHRGHRAIDCRQCHPAAYADAPNPSRESKDVLIPPRNVCLKCHSPQSQSGAVPGHHVSSSPPGSIASSVTVTTKARRRWQHGAKAESPVRKLNQEEFQAAGTEANRKA